MRHRTSSPPPSAAATAASAPQLPHRGHALHRHSIPPKEILYSRACSSCSIRLPPPPLRQISGWYNVFLRDEILAEWAADGLHVHCHVSGPATWWLAPGRLRNFIFCREMPLVLDCVRYAERAFLAAHPRLPASATHIHFHAQVHTTLPLSPHPQRSRGARSPVRKLTAHSPSSAAVRQLLRLRDVSPVRLLSPHSGV
jgi:hypothetical protein